MPITTKVGRKNLSIAQALGTTIDKMISLDGVKDVIIMVTKDDGSESIIGSTIEGPRQISVEYIKFIINELQNTDDELGGGDISDELLNLVKDALGGARGTSH